MMRSAPLRESGGSSTWEFGLAGAGSRLFFLFAALYGAAVMILWVVLYRLQLPQAVPPVLWHAHEMLYGFAAAGMAGLFLAAVPDWSGAPPVGSVRLAALAIIWLLGRVAMAGIGTLPLWPAAIVDLAFIPVFVGVVIVPVLSAHLGRNLLVLALCAVVWAGDLTMHAGEFGWTYDIAERGTRIGLDAYLLLIVVIGGWTIPALINRALRAAGSRIIARSFPLLDGLAIASTALYLVSDGARGAGTLTSCIALAAAILNGTRLALWHGTHIRHAPTVWFLLIGYFWLVVGLLLEASTLVSGPVADMAATHVLAAGGIGTMLLAAMARAGIARDGQLFVHHPVMVAAYALVSLAAILRVAALFVPDAFVDLVIVSGIVWALGFVVFLVFYLPGAVFHAPQTTTANRA